MGGGHCAGPSVPPSRISHAVSTSGATSRRSWLTTSSVHSCFSLDSRPVTSARLCQSSPASGSSSSSRLGCRTSCTASASRRCWPPDSAVGGMSSGTCERPTAAKTCCVRLLSSKRAVICGGHAKLSSLAMVSPRKWRSGNWKTRPTRRMRSSRLAAAPPAPPNDTLPPVCSHSPASSCKSVVLPEPERPMMSESDRGGSSMLTSESSGASTPGGWNDSPRTVTPRGAAACCAAACCAAACCATIAMSCWNARPPSSSPIGTAPAPAPARGGCSRCARARVCGREHRGRGDAAGMHGQADAAHVAVALGAGLHEASLPTVALMQRAPLPWTTSPWSCTAACALACMRPCVAGLQFAACMLACARAARERERDRDKDRGQRVAGVCTRSPVKRPSVPSTALFGGCGRAQATGRGLDVHRRGEASGKACPANAPPTAPCVAALT
mmetsp:Transcript_20007/g.59442  ORF Transcript_20007/g.59442 Transcript_20007/m.59442 type:complete len:442 (-) Transcript_20007:90-1415(-)